MSFRRFVLMPVVLLVGTAVSALAQSGSSTFTHTSSFGPVGLGSTETAQVNLLNTASASSSGTAASCTGTVAFTGATGAAIGSSTNFTVAGGEIVSVSLPFSKATTSGSRIEIVATITLTQTSGTPCSLVTSFETFDTTSGATDVYLSGAQTGGGPGPIGH